MPLVTATVGPLDADEQKAAEEIETYGYFVAPDVFHGSYFLVDRSTDIPLPDTFYCVQAALAFLRAKRH